MKNKAARLLKKMMEFFGKAKSITDLKNKVRHLKTRLMIYSLLSSDKKVLFGSISNKLQGFIVSHRSHPPNPIHQVASASAAFIAEEKAVEGEFSNISLQTFPVLYNNMNSMMPPANVMKVIDTHDQHEEEEELIDQKAAATGEEESNFPTPSTHEHEEIQEDDDDDIQKDRYPDLRHSLFEDDEYEMGRPGSVIELVKKTKESQQGGKFNLEDQIDEVADLFIKRFHRHVLIQKQNSFKRRTPPQLTN